MIKIDVLFGDNPFSATWQKKSFEHEGLMRDWCKKNHKKIWQINDRATAGRELSYIEYMIAMKGDA